MSELMINRAKAIIDLATEEEKAELLEYIRPKGEWLEHVYARKCSVCGSVTCWTDDDGDPIPGNFCPNCGARMINPREDEGEDISDLRLKRYVDEQAGLVREQLYTMIGEKGD